MRILFDQGTPAPLRRHLAEHDVVTAYDAGWADLDNGNLLSAAEGTFDLLLTTDKNLRYQQNLTGRRLAICLLPTTSWPRIRMHITTVVDAVNSVRTGEYREISFTP